MIKRYAPTAEPVEAVFLTEATLEEAARWCGGEVNNDPSPAGLDQAWDRVVMVPGIPNAFSVPVGWYLVKSQDNKFRGWQKDHFEREYHEVGKRQDGFIMRNPIWPHSGAHND